MRTPSLPVVLLLLAGIPFATAPAAGASRVVVPGGSVDAIADAIAEAGPGGVVELASGTHVLTATVVVDRAGVLIEGQSGATLLGRGAVPGGRLVLFSAAAEGVSFADLSVAPDPAHVGDLAVVEVVGGGRTTVSRCRAEGVTQLVDDGGFPGLVAERNHVEVVALTESGAPAAHAAAIRASGDGEVLVARNVLDGVRGAGSVGIEVRPPAEAVHEVVKNRIEGFEDAISGEGEGRALVTRNRVRRCGNGIVAGSGTTARGWEIVRNVVIDVLAVGVYLGDGDGCVVSKNRVLRAGTDGINVGGVFLTVRGNRGRLDAGYGLYGATNSSDYTRNKAKRCGDGIRVQGSGNRLKRNRASKNLGDGVVSTGGNVNAEGNRGSRNGGTQVSIQ